MIELLHGKVAVKHPTFVVIECAGVGYGVQVSARTGELIPEAGNEITLLTHLIVREDAMILFGFIDEQEKELFLKMIEVNGVGPKMAQRILSSVSPSDLLSMIAREDKASLSKIKGVGKKTVEQLVLSLKDKATALAATGDAAETIVLSSAEQEAILALHTLGVKDQPAKDAVKKAVEILGTGTDVAKLIPEALKHI